MSWLWQYNQTRNQRGVRRNMEVSCLHCKAKLVLYVLKLRVIPYATFWTALIQLVTWTPHACPVRRHGGSFGNDVLEAGR